MSDVQTFAIAVAQLADLDGILDLHVAVAGEARWIATELPIDRAARGSRIAAAIEHPAAVSLVARADNGIVGHATLIAQREGLLGLGMMVAAGWRSRGVGGALLTRAIAAARALGAYKIVLDVFPDNTAARALYARHGFVEEGYFRRHLRRASGELWDAIPMGLALD